MKNSVILDYFISSEKFKFFQGSFSILGSFFIIPPTQVNRIPFYPGLDSLRALAVIAVMFHHFNESYFKTTRYGYLALAGVNLFFVLSGFLITGILIRARNLLEAEGREKTNILVKFYLHRFFRIFPLYYLLVALALLVGISTASKYWLPLLTYTFNYTMISSSQFIEPFSHFWTLAVEAQFYVIWPFFVLFIPRLALIPLTSLLVFISPLYRYLILMGPNNSNQIYPGELGWHISLFGLRSSHLGSYVSLLSCIDVLCIGALLALITLSKRHKDMLRLLRYWIVPVATLLVIVFWFFPDQKILDVYIRDIDFVIGKVPIGLIFAFIIYQLTRPQFGLLGVLSSWHLLRYLGKISYGLYVYHPFVPYSLAGVFALAGIKWPQWLTGSSALILSFALSLTAASLSWAYFERPVNKLRLIFDKRIA